MPDPKKPLVPVDHRSVDEHTDRLLEQELPPVRVPPGVESKDAAIHEVPGVESRDPVDLHVPDVAQRDDAVHEVPSVESRDPVDLRVPGVESREPVATPDAPRVPQKGPRETPAVPGVEGRQSVDSGPPAVPTVSPRYAETPMVPGIPDRSPSIQPMAPETQLPISVPFIDTGRLNFRDEPATHQTHWMS